MIAVQQKHHNRPSNAVRGDYPYPECAGNPRLREMTEAARDILSRDGGVTADELRMLGFSSTEIVEYAPQIERAVRQANRTAFDRFPDLADRFRHALPKHPPRMGGNRTTEKQAWIWQAWCRAHAAMKIDPSKEQAARCLMLASEYSATLPILPREEKALTQHLRAHLGRILERRETQQ